MRTRNLSLQGRELFSSGYALTSVKLSPRSQRKTRPNSNVFQALGGESDEDDEFKTDEEEYPEPQGYSTTSKPISPRMFSSENSPRWEKVMPQHRRTPPRLELEAEQTETPVPFVLTPPPPATISTTRALSFGSQDNGDISMLSSLETDFKARRDTQRSAHGSKANRFKALKQRLDSMAKREGQREAAKATAKAKRAAQNDEDGEGEWEDEDEGWVS